MPRVVLVTSAIAHEGKTTVAVCLGLASVSSGQRVLIIDCDFSRPQVHKVMRVDNDRGLTDVLAGTVALEDAICHATGSPLSVLPADRKGVVEGQSVSVRVIFGGGPYFTKKKIT